MQLLKSISQSTIYSNILNLNEVNFLVKKIKQKHFTNSPLESQEALQECRCTITTINQSAQSNCLGNNEVHTAGFASNSWLDSRKLVLHWISFEIHSIAEYYMT